MDKKQKPTETKRKPDSNPTGTQHQPSETSTTPNLTNQHTMEVHHPHHLTHKKKWSEYLLEFAMLFLAVFLGFLAENKREHIVERHREKDFMHSLREDFTSDTAILQTGIARLVRNSIGADSLSTMIQDGRVKSADDIYKLYNYNLTALSGFLITLTDRTEAQLKNSGGMRLITNKKVSDAIVDYWKGSEELKNFFLDVHQYRTKARDKSYMIFDNKYYSRQEIGGDKPVLANPQLMTNDHATITEFGNRINHIKNLTRLYINYLKAQKTKADSLMALIDEQY